MRDHQVQELGLDRWSKITNKPLINDDSSFTITDSMQRPYGPVADNLKQRADWTNEFFQQAFERQEFLGCHYCGLIDASNLVPYKLAY